MLANRKLRSHMAAMGFVDVHDDGSHNAVEMIGASLSGPVASLQLAILEQIAGRQAQVKGGQIEIGAKQFKLDEKGRVQCDFLSMKHPRAIPIMDVLGHKISKEMVKGKVVVIGYSRADSPVFRVSQESTMPVHEYFYREVMCLADQF